MYILIFVLSTNYCTSPRVICLVLFLTLVVDVLFHLDFFFLLTLALRTKSMALGATVLAPVLIEITGAIVRNSPTLRLIHITFEPFLSPPSFLRFQQ